MHQPDKNAGWFKTFLKFFSKLAFLKISISVFAGYAFVSGKKKYLKYMALNL